MDGNLVMADRIVYETEEQNNFWADVYKYMQDTNCDKETAIKDIGELYNKSIDTNKF